MARMHYPKLEDLPEKLRTRVAALPPLNILRMFLHAASISSNGSHESYLNARRASGCHS